MEFRKTVMMTLYVRQQKRHRCKEQTFGLVIYLTYDNIHVSMLFAQITQPSPSPTESKCLFFTSVSLLLSHIQGHCYHLSKFHIYELIYCIGVFLFDLLHSVNRLQFHPPH